MTFQSYKNHTTFYPLVPLYPTDSASNGMPVDPLLAHEVAMWPMDEKKKEE
jgi:hypothetical protein